MSRNNKTKRTKKQRKQIRLRRAKKHFGVEDFYFFEYLSWRHPACKYAVSKNNLCASRDIKPMGVLKLRECLKDITCPIINLDTEEIYSSIEEFRMEALIIKLAQI